MNDISYEIFNKDLEDVFSFKTPMSTDIYKLYSKHLNLNVPYMDVSFSGKNLFFVAIENDETIGMLSLSYDESGFFNLDKPELGRHPWCSTGVSVDPAHQGKGIAKKLMENMFEFCVFEGISKVLKSSYTKDGESYLKPVSIKLQEKYNQVEMIG